MMPKWVQIIAPGPADPRQSSASSSHPTPPTPRNKPAADFPLGGRTKQPARPEYNPRGAYQNKDLKSLMTLIMIHIDQTSKVSGGFQETSF